jgi:hypothetical protein
VSTTGTSGFLTVFGTLTVFVAHPEDKSKQTITAGRAKQLQLRVGDTD